MGQFIPHAWEINEGKNAFALFLNSVNDSMEVSASFLILSIILWLLF